MFFRPILGQATFVSGELPRHAEGLRQRMEAKPVPTGDPVIAIFDGLPLEQHAALRDRLII